MRTQSSDTHPEIERMQIEMLKCLSPQERLERMNEWNKATLELAWRGLQRAHPEATEQELGILYVAIHYGQPLADRLREYLRKRGEPI
jgi:hypothetical protein